MHYNIRHRQFNSLSLLNNSLICLLHSSVNLIVTYLALSRLLHLYCLILKCLSKLILLIVPLLLLCSSFNTQALSAKISNAIEGSPPYLTFDNGVTKITTIDDLLGITLSDGTHITPENNTSAITPIVLPNADKTLANVQMLVPAATNSIDLSTLIGPLYNYWGDDDGDGQGTNGITATGNLSVSITNKDNQAVSRNATLDACKAPYKVELTSTAGSLTTKYGVPNSRSFSGGTATYYISPAIPKICYAMPNLQYGTNLNNGWNYSGPTNIWSPTKGFLVQSTESSSSNRNFPTTGANNLYFDLLVENIDATTLTWPAVTQGNITAAMMPSPDNPNNIRVILTGPEATASQISSDSPGRIATPTLPQTFVLVGKDSSNREVLSYSFELKQWFVNRGNRVANYANQSSWCTSLGDGYHLSHVKELTNAVCSGNGIDIQFPCTGAVGATPSSSGDYYQRNIGAGLFTEWGSMSDYTAAGFMENYWTSDSNGSKQFFVYSKGGRISGDSPSKISYAICAYP